MNLLVVKIGNKEFIKTTKGLMDLARIVRIETDSALPDGLRFWLDDGSYFDRVPVQHERKAETNV